MKRFWIISLFLVFVASSYAQGDYEAFRFSQIDYMGTARYMGAGGTFGTVGGDFSGLFTNPAAIGLYKRHEVSFTPMMISFFKDNTLYNGTNSYTQNPKYTVPECGLVITSPIVRDSEWKYWQFGFGYNRIMDYNNTFRAVGTPNTSFINPILSRANGINYQQLSADAMIAWNTWLIDTFPGQSANYFSPFSDANLDQSTLVKQTGSIDEMSFTFGGNYNDKLFLGLSVGIPFLDYQEVTSLTEQPTDVNHLSGITDYNVYTFQRDRGAGVNAKIGVIYQPVNFLRLSAGIQTPSYFWKIKDTYRRSMTSHWVSASDESSEYSYNYQFSLTTPFRFNLGTAFLINKRAFISAEYEFNDYRMATLYANDYDFSNENALTREKYNACHTIRIGGEVNLSPSFALRAGYNFKTSPYANSDQWAEGFNGSAHYGSFGFGYRAKYFFVDLAYIVKFSKDSYNLYTPNATAQVKNTTHRVAATIGCKF